MSQAGRTAMQGTGVGLNWMPKTGSWTKNTQFLVLSKHPFPNVVIKPRDS